MIRAALPCLCLFGFTPLSYAEESFGFPADTVYEYAEFLNLPPELVIHQFDEVSLLVEIRKELQYTHDDEAWIELDLQQQILGGALNIMFSAYDIEEAVSGRIAAEDIIYIYEGLVLDIDFFDASVTKLFTHLSKEGRCTGDTLHTCSGLRMDFGALRNKTFELSESALERGNKELARQANHEIEL